MSWLVQKTFNVTAGMTVPGFYKESKIYAAYTVFTEAYVLLSIISFFIGALQEEGVYNKVYCFSVVVYYNQILVAMIHIRFSRAELIDLVELCKPNPGETVSTEFNITRHILPYLMNSCLTAVSTIWSLYPMFFLNKDGTRSLAIPAYYPFPYDETPYFEIACFLQGITGFLIAAKTAAFYDFYVNLGARLTAKFTYLRKDLPRVVNDKENTTQSLREWIKNHQHISSVGVKFQQLFSRVLLYLFGVEFLELFLCGSDIDKGTDFIHLALGGIYYSAAFLKLFLITRSGDLIKHESSRITEEGFGARWYELPLKDQNSLKVIIAKTNREFTISAMGVVPLTTDTFKSIVMSAYSYLMILKKFN